MKKLGAPACNCRRMWPGILAVLLVYFLPVGWGWGQVGSPALAHLVRPTPGARPLGEVLAELSRQGGLPFSYSSSLVPVTHQCFLRSGPARPLGVVLREVLADKHLSYGLLNGQLVLWPNHVAAPVGVAAVNGRPMSLAQPPPLPASSVLVTTAREREIAKKGALGSGPAGRLASASGGGEARVLNSAKRSRKEDASSGFSAGRSLPNNMGANRTTQPQTALANPSTPTTRPLRPSSTAKPSSKTALIVLPRRSRSQTRPIKPEPDVSPGRFSVSSSSPTSSSKQPQVWSAQTKVSLASLPSLLVPLKTDLTPGGPPRSVPALAGWASERNPLVGLNQKADSAARKLLARNGLLRRSYLHGEAWVSESLPLNVAFKVGIPRLYLVLAVAADRFDRQLGWAGGVGVGTSGQPWGRFTPSLDLMQWFLAGTGDKEPSRGQLTQLRPALAWQLKQGGRWQLVGGPTLNLATAHRERGRSRWAVGQDQWLWLNSGGEQSLVRLWPGVQLGVRF
ncbi:hypothetical protein [uncultured Hymenobacter sp.]|uniref:hypothetical protein n=1 Tax=uncultured Hymenobacter sp. TaxID=170016 RepID=UPI0035CC59F3